MFSLNPRVHHRNWSNHAGYGSGFELGETMIIGLTGHRPPRLGLGYTKDDSLFLFKFAVQCLQEEGEITELISGVAQGWDRAGAEAAYFLCVPVRAAVPFEGQESKWPEQAQEDYRDFLTKCKVVVVSPGGYSNSKFFLRDKYIVDNCHKLLALYDGEEKGGTWQTVKYAKSKGIPIVNCWDKWEKYKERCCADAGSN
jgi:uncharacterized phage-like protein YoqJ